MPEPSPDAAVRSQSHVSTAAVAVCVPEDAQHKQEQDKELGQHSIAPTAFHTQQGLLVLFPLLSVIRECSVPVLHSFPLSQHS